MSQTKYATIHWGKRPKPDASGPNATLRDSSRRKLHSVTYWPESPRSRDQAYEWLADWASQNGYEIRDSPQE